MKDAVVFLAQKGINSDSFLIDFFSQRERRKSFLHRNQKTKINRLNKQKHICLIYTNLDKAFKAGYSYKSVIAVFKWKDT